MNDAPTASPRPWWQPGPFQYSKVEMLVMRALFAALLFSRHQVGDRALQDPAQSHRTRAPL